ncbi:MAG: hypothetical protein N3G21_02420 [Candidatus Hydrogenedentes bacterium]|nr:hypothetical protein [Candidatus Hydrogenedentota bacterium]
MSALAVGYAVLDAVEQWSIYEVKRTARLTTRDIVDVLKPISPTVEPYKCRACIHRYGVIKEKRKRGSGGMKKLE